MNDEARFTAALLHAGAEPKYRLLTNHAQWQLRASDILMQKYQSRWWYKCGRKHTFHTGKLLSKRMRACVDIYNDVRNDELTKFYAWVCKSRAET